MAMRRVKVFDDFGAYQCTVSVPAASRDFEGGTLGGFCMPGIKALRGRSFAGAEMYWAVLAEADLSGCNFDGADLRGANLRGALLCQASLRSANLSRDNLGGSTRLQGADLSGATLNGAKLDGAEYDGRTIFPTGFSPEAHGMVETDGVPTG